MNSAFIIFVLCLLAACSYAIMRGGRDERLGALSLATAAVLSPLVMSNDWGNPEYGVILIDVGLFVALTNIALRSRAFWPMWASGFQLCGLAVHVAAVTSHDMMPFIYAETLAIWAYPVMVALATGTYLESPLREG